MFAWAAKGVHHRSVRRAVILIGVTVGVVGLLLWSLDSFGARSVWFAFCVVWLPMVWLGTVSRFMVPQLPARYHALRAFELDGHIYDLLGVRLVKWLLRRGPLAVFNPDLHMPAERTEANMAHLEQRMKDAEASHFILLLLTLGVIVHAAVRGWWASAAWTLLFDVLVNGYPVMLQRYNRARLRRRLGR